ncbi:serine-rich adhesin for platelets-like [Emydura macquarii macquarii]|uniref:serine-rich adhesin for platelets-like n=1 Tax=Emydura macquarii macquarii TaxID=1129001 RepID=UPI00352A6EF7
MSVWNEYRKETKNNHEDLEIFMAWHSLCFAGKKKWEIYNQVTEQTNPTEETSTISTVPNTEKVPKVTTSSNITDTKSNSPPAFTDQFSSTASVTSDLDDKSTAFAGSSPVTHLSTTAQTASEISSNKPVTTAFSTEITLLSSTASRVDGTSTLNPLETEFSTSLSSSPVSKNTSQVSEQTASVGVSGHGPTATNNPSIEETSFGTSVTITESSLGLKTTKAELPTVTSELTTQEDVTSSSIQTTLNVVTAPDLSHSSVHSTAERPSTDTEKSALPVSTVLLDSTTVASAVTSHFTSNISPQTEVSQMTSTISTVPNTEKVPTVTTSSNITDTKSKSPPPFMDQFSSTASVSSDLDDKSTAFVGSSPVTHLSTKAQTPEEISSNTPATTAFSTETTLPASTTSRGDGTSTSNPLETEFSTSFSSSPVSKNASQVSEQTASVSVSGHGPIATSNPSIEETSSGTSVTINESSIGLKTTKAELPTVTSEPTTQEDVTSSSIQTTLNVVTAPDLSHSSVHSTAERPSGDTEKSALPVSTVLPDSTIVASAATSRFTSNISPQKEVSQMTSTIGTIPNTERLPTGTTNSDKTDTESNTPPVFTHKFSSTGTNPMTHPSTAAQTPAEISSNSPVTTAFSTETTLPASTTSRVDGTSTSNPLETEFSTSFSSSPVSKNASQVSEQTASVGVSGHGPTATNNPSIEETSSGTSVTITESTLGLATPIAELSTVTNESNTKEDVTSSSNRTTLNVVTEKDLSHSSVHSTAEGPSTDIGKSALPVSTVLLDSTTVASAVTSHFTSNISPQTEVSQMTSTISTVPNTEKVPPATTSSNMTDTKSNTPPTFTDQFSSTASVSSDLDDKSTAFVGRNPMTHLSTTAQTAAEISSNTPATTAFSTETTLPASTRSKVDDTTTLNPVETEFSTSFSSSPVSKNVSQVSEQTASVGVSGHGPITTNNPSIEETSSGTSVTITESTLGLTTPIAELSTVTNEPNKQEDVTSSSNGTTVSLVTATDLSHSSVHSTAERPSTDTEKSALPVSTILLDSTTVASAPTSRFTSNISPQKEVSQMTSTIGTVPNTERLPTGTTNSDKTDTESNTPPVFTHKFSSTGTNPMTHPSAAAQTPAEIPSNSPATTSFFTETTLPASTRSRGDGTSTSNPLETEFSTSFSSSPVAKNASQVSEQTASVGVSGHGPTATNNPSIEETSSGTSVTINESSLGLKTTKAKLPTVTSEPTTQEDVTSSSIQTTLNVVTAPDLSHSSVHSTAERPSTDTEKSALPVSTVLPDSTTVASAATSRFTSNISPQKEVSQMTSTIGTIPNTERLPTGTTNSDKTDTESNTPPVFTHKFSSTGTNPMTHPSTAAQTPAEISSNSPVTTAFSTETTLPASTTSRVDGTSTSNPLETEFSTSFSSSPVSKNASQVSEQTASVGVSGHGPTATNNPSIEETSSGTSVTITESTLGLATPIAELSTVTNESNTKEDVTSSSNRTTLNVVTEKDLSHSSVHSTAEGPSTDIGKSALPVSTVLLDSTTVASAVTSHFTSNISPQTEVSQMTSTISTVPNTEKVSPATTSSNMTDTKSNTPPTFTDQFSSTASVSSDLDDKSTAFVGRNPMTHLSTTAQTAAEISSNTPATTAFSTETTLPASTRSKVDDTTTLNPVETEFSTSFSSSPVSKNVSQVSEQTASVGVSGHGPITTNNPSIEETSSGTSVTITESTLGLTTPIAELSTVTNEPNKQEDVTSSSNGTTVSLVTATDLSHSSVHSTAERPSTDTEKSALPVSTILLDSTTVASAPTSRFTSNISPQKEVSQMTSTIGTVPNTERLPTGTTNSDKTDTESNTPPVFTHKFSSTGTNPMTHPSAAAQTPAEIPSNSPATTSFFTETTLPASTRSRGDGTSTSNPLETEFSTSFSSSPVAKNASQVSEQTASVGVSGHGPTATNNPSIEETSSGTSVTINESSLGLKTTKAKLPTVTSEPVTQEDVTSSSIQTTLNVVTAPDLSHSSVHSTAERPSTDTEKSALPVSTVLPDSTTVASAATSRFTSNISPQKEVSQMTSTIGTIPNTERLPTGTTNSDKTDTESNTPPVFTHKFSSTGTNPMTHPSTAAQTPAEISSNSPVTTAFSTETTLPASTTSRVDGTSTSNPLETEFSTSFSSSPVSKNVSQVSEQTASVGVSGHGPIATNNPSIEETSSGTSVTITESTLGLTTPIAELSTVTNEPNKQEDVTSSSNGTTPNLVTEKDLSHSSVHSTAEEPSTDIGKSALPVSTVLLDRTTVASAVTSHFTSNISPQTEVSQMTSTISTVPNTEKVPPATTSSNMTDTKSNTPPVFTDQFSSTASVSSDLDDKSTAFVGSNPMTHLSTTAQTAAEISSNTPATTAFSTETTLPTSTRSKVDDTTTLNPVETEFSTSFSSSPVSKNVSQVSEQTASVGVSGHGPTATNNPSIEETSSGTSVPITKSSLGLITTIAELSMVTNEPNTQEDITSSSNGTTLNVVTEKDLSHSSVHSTAERPSTDTEKSALPLSTVLLDRTTVASTAASDFTTNISAQTEISQITITSSRFPNTERVLTGTTSSDTAYIESNTSPAFTDKFSSTASNPMTHLSTTVQTPAEISFNSPATTRFSSAFTGIDTSFPSTSITPSASSALSNSVQFSTPPDRISANETVMVSSTTAKSTMPITVPNTAMIQNSSIFSTPNIAVSPPAGSPTIIPASPTKTSFTSKSAIILSTIHTATMNSTAEDSPAISVTNAMPLSASTGSTVTVGDSSSKNTKPTIRVTAPEAAPVSAITKSTLTQGICSKYICAFY